MAWEPSDMRRALWFVLIILGHLTACAEEPPSRDRQPSAPPAASATKKTAAEPGSDWPQFLGPTGDSKSNERGILTRWPVAGPPLVWQLPLGTGYGMCTISTGRSYQFDRAGDSARLRCLDSKTGKPLWTFRYPSQFEDLYGYDNGPRCSPVIDEGRVYIFGAEGMLHCLSADRGRGAYGKSTRPPNSASFRISLALAARRSSRATC